MKNIRKYNNNVVLASDKGQEVIVLGKGLGFMAAPGSELDMALVEMVFVPQETAQMNRFSGFLSSLPYEYLLLAGHIVDYGREHLSQKLNQSIVIALADHLHFAAERFRKHLDIQMDLLWDIRHIYPEEFKIGEKALELIKEELGQSLPREEAAAIALHFVNAESETGGGVMPNTVKSTMIIKKIVSMIEEYYGITLDETSFDFLRFVAHLRNAILRFINNTKASPLEDEDLSALFRERYAKAFECSQRVCDYLRDTMSWNLTRSDQSFMAIHIGRLTAGRYEQEETCP